MEDEDRGNLSGSRSVSHHGSYNTSVAVDSGNCMEKVT